MAELAVAISIISAIGMIWSVITVHTYKSKDFQIRREELINNINIILDEIDEKLPTTKKARERRLAAQGKNESGEHIAWKKMMDVLKAKLEKNRSQFFQIEKKSSVFKKFERDISPLHKIHGELHSVLASVQASLDEDAKNVDAIKAEKLATRMMPSDKAGGFTIR